MLLLPLAIPQTFHGAIHIFHVVFQTAQSCSIFKTATECSCREDSRKRTGRFREFHRRTCDMSPWLSVPWFRTRTYRDLCMLLIMVRSLCVRAQKFYQWFYEQSLSHANLRWAFSVRSVVTELSCPFKLFCVLELEAD